jgi:hypothetical protein
MMALAGNATVSRTTARELFSTDSLSSPIGVDTTTYYRGVAIGLVNGGTTDVLSKDFSGATHVTFMGVNKRELLLDVNTSAKAYLALKRDGAVVFNAVTGLNAAAVPAASTAGWLHRPVFFRSDNEVSLHPQPGAIGGACVNPIYAGRVIATSATPNYAGLGASEVLVNISDAVRTPLTYGTMQVNLHMGTLTSGATLTGATIPVARRMWIHRAVVVCNIALTTATAAGLSLLNGAVAISGGAGGTSCGITLGATTIVYTDVAAALLSASDSLVVTMVATGDPDVLTGVFSCSIEYLPLW